MTWLQLDAMLVWQRVKAGERLDLDMDGYVPKEKQEEWKRILEEVPWRRLGLQTGKASQLPPMTTGAPRPPEKQALLEELEKALGD